MCPGRVVFSDNETPFPLFSSAEEAQQIFTYIVGEQIAACGQARFVNVHKDQTFSRYREEVEKLDALTLISKTQPAQV